MRPIPVESWICGSDTTTRLPGSLTVTKDSAGRYFPSFVVDTEPDVLPGRKTDAGIDLGKALKHGRTLAKVDRALPSAR